jgi:hypothetical protein
MTVHILSGNGATARHVAPPIEIFRWLSEFRQGGGEGLLQDLFDRLRLRMGEVEADRVMSDALALDNEIRFRRPGGLELRPRGDVFLSADEAALAALIGHAHDLAIAPAMAEKLGIGSHDILRQHAASFAGSLREGGIEYEWEGAATAAMAVTAYTAPLRFGAGP